MNVQMLQEQRECDTHIYFSLFSTFVIYFSCVNTCVFFAEGKFILHLVLSLVSTDINI